MGINTMKNMNYIIYAVSFVMCMTVFLVGIDDYSFSYKTGIAITISALVSALPVLFYSIYVDLKQ